MILAPGWGPKIPSKDPFSLIEVIIKIIKVFTGKR